MTDRHSPEELNAGHRHTRIKMVGVQESAVRVSRARMFFTASIFTLLFLTLSVRLVALAVNQQGEEPTTDSSANRSSAAFERADIVDRNGFILATDLLTASLYANPRQILDPISAARRLKKVLPRLSEKKLLAKLTNGRAFIWLKRNLTPKQQSDVFKLAIPGIWFQPEQRRVYPQGPLGAHILGFTDIDRRGIAGIEQYFNETLKQRAQRGGRLELSIDVRVQHALQQELSRAMIKFKSVGAAGVVLDANTGEVIAMVSLPDFDPNQPPKSSDNRLFNRATKGVYELGSVFKVFTIAMALDSGTVTLASGYDATRPIRISGFTIRDDHPKRRWLSVPEIFMYSSNIGAAKMAIDVGGVRQRNFMDRLGLLRRSSLQLPEVGSPLSPMKWRDVNTMTIAFGHGVAVSPLQLASGIAAVVNGGVLVPPTLIKRKPGDDVMGKRVLSEKTSLTMRRLLRLVVAKGTGRKADAKGYLVGGKTGTAEKAGVEGYRSGALITSFVAVFPMNAPRYVVYAFLDEPKGIKETHGLAAAGWNSAPTAGRIVLRIAPILGVRPQNSEAESTKKLLNVDRLIGGRKKLASY